MLRRDITLETSLRKPEPTFGSEPRARLSADDRWGARHIVGYGYLNSVTLMTAPRSPSLPPSLG